MRNLGRPGTSQLIVETGEKIGQASDIKTSSTAVLFEAHMPAWELVRSGPGQMGPL